MRDKRFIAVHRGGSLNKEQHVRLLKWACECAEDILPLFGEPPDFRLKNALLVAKNWSEGKATVGDARKASLSAIAVANECVNPVSKAVARAVGHAVATAHMADHSLGAAIYALKALKSTGKPVEEKRNWQNEKLPIDLRDLVVSNRNIKEAAFKDLKKG